MTVRAPSYSGTIVNAASVSSSTSDPNPDDNTATVSTEVVQFNLSDLAVKVTASANPVLVHRAVTFTTTVTNLGPHAAAGVQLSLSPPFLADILSVTPSQGTCMTTTDSIDCSLGAMAIAAGATLTLEVKPQTDGFALTTAFVSGYGDPLFFDPNSENDFASVSVDVNYPGNADPALTQTSHQTIPYPALVENTCSGDIIYLSGTVREIVSLTSNKNRVRGNTLTDYRGITGIGLLSGKTYRASGGSRTGTGLSLVFNGWYPYEFTSVDKVRLVANDERLWLHENLHLTINGNWTYTATVNNATVQCK